MVPCSKLVPEDGYTDRSIVGFLSSFKQTPEQHLILSSSSSPFTPCGAYGIHEELLGITISSYSLDFIP
jgi:hypothetical protein